MNGRPRIHLPPRDLSGSNYKYESVLMTDVLYDGDFNCRGEFTYESVAELAETIAAATLLHPIILWPKPGLPLGKRLMLVCGHRRYRAFELLKQTHIPSMIRDDLDQRQAEILNLTENLARKDLNILQEALALKKRFPDGGALRTISREINQSAVWVEQRVKLLKLPEEVQRMFAAERIPGHFITKLYTTFTDKGVEKVLEDARAIEAARSDKGLVQRKRLPASLQKTPYPPPTQAEVIKVMAIALDSSIGGLIPKYHAYREGWISQEEIIKEFKKRVPKWSRRVIEEIEFPETP